MDVVSAYFLLISYIYVIGCGVAMTADVDGYSQININTILQYSVYCAFPIFSI